MKSLILIICAVSFLTACNSNQNQETEALKAKQITIDSMKAVIAKQAVIDSMKAIVADREAQLATEREEKLAAESEEKTSQVVANNNITATPVAARKKKGWNHTAKGAVVGAGTGAITGAIINKKHAQGALVGSLIGAGIGAGTGAIVDHSKKKKNNGN